MEPKETAKLDQALAGMMELAGHLPRVWRKMFVGLTTAGFTDEQAMDLLKTYINTAYGFRD